MNTFQLAKDITVLQDSIRENKIKMEKQLSMLKRDLYVAFGGIFLFLFSGLMYQLYTIFK